MFKPILKTLIVLGLIAVTLSCTDSEDVKKTYPSTTYTDKDSNPPSLTLVDQVVKKFGTNGQLCFQRYDDTTYCYSQTSKSAIALGDVIDRDTPLMLCAEVAGELRNCEPAVLPSIACNFTEHTCNCTGLDDCAFMARSCKSGSCGNCEVGQCCGTDCQEPQQD